MQLKWQDLRWEIHRTVGYRMAVIHYYDRLVFVVEWSYPPMPSGYQVDCGKQKFLCDTPVDVMAVIHSLKPKGWRLWLRYASHMAMRWYMQGWHHYP